jgi:hypothetical protein
MILERSACILKKGQAVGVCLTFFQLIGRFKLENRAIIYNLIMNVRL